MPSDGFSSSSMDEFLIFSATLFNEEDQDTWLVCLCRRRFAALKFEEYMYGKVEDSSTLLQKVKPSLNPSQGRKLTLWVH